MRMTSKSYLSRLCSKREEKSTGGAQEDADDQQKLSRNVAREKEQQKGRHRIEFLNWFFEFGASPILLCNTLLPTKHYQAQAAP